MEQSFAIQILFNDTFSGARKDAGVAIFELWLTALQARYCPMRVALPVSNPTSLRQSRFTCCAKSFNSTIQL